MCSNARSSSALVVGMSRTSLGMVLVGARGEEESSRWRTGKGLLLLLFRVEVEEAL